jgi:radical SAM protein with 4Fe4S-binding SPASM domain
MEPATKNRLLESVARAGLKPPRVLTLMITNNCNLGCRHCWPESLSHGSMSSVPVETLKRLITDFCALGVQEICLTGGEPLTHSEWREVLRFACLQKDLERVRLQTNGTLLTQRDVKYLSSMDKKKLLIQVSLEGDTNRIHDHMRGKGSFQKALRGLKYLTEAGLGSQTVVAFTETEYNFDRIPLLLQYLDRVGIGRFVSGTLVQAGRAKDHSDLAPPTPEQYKSLLHLYHRDEIFRNRYHKMANIACLEWWLGKADSLSEDCACFEFPYVTADGALYPCIMLPVENLAVGNAHEEPVAQLLMKAVSRWSGLPALRQRRSALLVSCETCPGHRHCAGGCMGRAYAGTGDFMKVEDRCLLRKAVYAWEPI